MNNALLQTEDATAFITRALNDFLRDHHLALTPQQYEKLEKLLMVRLLDEEMSYENAYNHLTDIKEHRKDYQIDANAPDEAEEEMIRIIGAADFQQVEVAVETMRYKKRFYVTLGILGLVCLGLAISMVNNHLGHQRIETLAMMQVIDRDEENVIKDLVQQVVTMETKNGNEITHSAVYKELKELDAITTHGTATSYKKFNKAQYKVAVEYLNGRVTP